MLTSLCLRWFIPLHAPLVGICTAFNNVRLQVVRQCNLEEGAQLEFSGILFQPVPWSVSSKRGMPAELEPYADDPEHYTIINVPPNFMCARLHVMMLSDVAPGAACQEARCVSIAMRRFSSKIFKPSRLCAVYKRKT